MEHPIQPGDGIDDSAGRLVGGSTPASLMFCRCDQPMLPERVAAVGSRSDAAGHRSLEQYTGESTSLAGLPTSRAGRSGGRRWRRRNVGRCTRSRLELQTGLAQDTLGSASGLPPRIQLI